MTPRCTRWAVIALIALPASASAEVITRCGASSGEAHYPESELVPKALAGWRKDGISNGSLQLARDGDQFSGRGMVVWGSIRGGQTLPKSSLLEAPCGRR